MALISISLMTNDTEHFIIQFFIIHLPIKNRIICHNFEGIHSGSKSFVRYMHCKYFFPSFSFILVMFYK